MFVLQLGFAFSIYSLLVWTGLDLLRKPQALTQGAVDAAKKLKLPIWAATAVIATTVASGAFVAGNDAGRLKEGVFWSVVWFVQQRHHLLSLQVMHTTIGLCLLAR